jgi:hypothetical protein
LYLFLFPVSSYEFLYLCLILYVGVNSVYKFCFYLYCCFVISFYLDLTSTFLSFSQLRFENLFPSWSVFFKPSLHPSMPLFVYVDVISLRICLSVCLSVCLSLYFCAKSSLLQKNVLSSCLAWLKSTLFPKK